MCKFDSGRFHDTRGSRDDGFRKVNGFTTKLNLGNQGKHIVGHAAYRPGLGKSILKMSIVEAQALVDQYAGTGEWKGDHKEIIDFKRPIGTWIHEGGTQRLETTRGTIHYGKKGCHIVPAQPIPRERG